MLQYEQVVKHIGVVNILVYIAAIISIVVYALAFSRNKPSLKRMIVIALFSAMAFVLSFIKILAMPQGGSINLLPMLPIMLIGILYGTKEGVTCGLIFGALSLMTGGHIVSIAEAILDYVFANIVLGLAGIAGREKKSHILVGSLLAIFLSVMCNIISGVYFYGMYAPPEMNLWWYSIIYNLSSVGVVGILSVVAIMALPIDRLKKHVK